MRTLIGLIAVLLGTIGVLAAIAVGVAVWPAAARVVERTDEFTTNANQRLDDVAPLLDRLEERAQETSTTVNEIGQAASRVASGTVKEDPTLSKRIQDLLQSLTPLLDQSESLGQMLQSATVMMRSAARIQSVFGPSSDSDQLDTMSANLDRAAAILKTINRDLNDIRKGQAVPQAEKVAQLAQMARGPLDQITGVLEFGQSQVSRIRDELARLHKTVHLGARIVPPVVDVLMLWFAVGQLCLIGWGRTRLTQRREPGETVTLS